MPSWETAGRKLVLEEMRILTSKRRVGTTKPVAIDLFYVVLSARHPPESPQCWEPEDDPQHPYLGTGERLREATCHLPWLFTHRSTIR